MVNKLKTRGSLLDKKSDRKRTALTEEKLGAIRFRLETSPGKSLKRLAQKTSVSKTCARRAAKVLHLRSYETKVVHALKQHGPAARIYFCNCFLQSVHDSEVDRH